MLLSLRNGSACQDRSANTTPEMRLSIRDASERQGLESANLIFTQNCPLREAAEAAHELVWCPRCAEVIAIADPTKKN